MPFFGKLFNSPAEMIKKIKNWIHQLILKYDNRRNQVCVSCGGDGISTCSNPDHGFIGMMGGDIGRIGCPGCGHHPEFKIPKEKCEWCVGGKMTKKEKFEYLGTDGKNE